MRRYFDLCLSVEGYYIEPSCTDNYCTIAGPGDSGGELYQIGFMLNMYKILYIFLHDHNLNKIFLTNQNKVEKLKIDLYGCMRGKR